MLTLKIQLILIILSVAAILFLTSKIKKGRIELKYALPWYIVVFSIFILATFPQIMEFVADFVGIADAVNMLFLFAIIYLLILLYKLTSSVSRLSDKVKRLTQEMAIMGIKYKDDLQMEKYEQKKD